MRRPVVLAALLAFVLVAGVASNAWQPQWHFSLPLRDSASPAYTPEAVHTNAYKPRIRLSIRPLGVVVTAAPTGTPAPTSTPTTPPTSVPTATPSPAFDACVNSATSPTLLWDLDDTNQTALDASGNANVGGYNGTYTQFEPSLTPSGASVNDGTYSTLLDGSSGYVQMPNSSLSGFQTTQLAYSEMVIEKQSAPNVGGGLMGLGSGSALANGNKFSAYIGDDGRIGAWFFASAVKYTVVTASGVPAAGNFADGNAHVVLVTFSAAAPTSGSAYAFTIYVDGTQRAQTTGTLGATLPTSGNVLWTLGAVPVTSASVTDAPASNYFAGYVQKGALWTYALTSANATTIENCAKNTGLAPSPTPALVQSTQQLRAKVGIDSHFSTTGTGYTSATVIAALPLMPVGVGLRDAKFGASAVMDNFFTTYGIKHVVSFSFPSLCSNGAAGCAGTSYANPTAYINAAIANVGGGCAEIGWFEDDNENDINPPTVNNNWWAPYTSWWAQVNADQQALYNAASVTCPGVPILSPPLADAFLYSTATTNAITSTGSQAATTSSPSSGSWYVMVGDQLAPNDGSNDLVTVTATTPGTSFTANFASTHLAGTVWTNPLDHQQQIASQLTACSGPCITAINSHDSDNTYISGNPESYNAVAAIFTQLRANMNNSNLPIWTTEWGDGGYAPWASSLANKTDDSVLERYDVRDVMYRLGVLGEGMEAQYQFANQTSDGQFGTEGLANQYGSLKIQAQAQRTLLWILPATGSGGSCSTSYTVGTGTAQNVFDALLYDAATCRHFTPIWLGTLSGPPGTASATPLPTAYPRQFESTTVTLPAGDTYAYWCSYTDPTGIAMVCYPWPVTGGTTTIPISDELGMLVSDNNGAWTLPTPQPTQAPAPGPTPSAIPTSTPTPYPSPSP